jgi:hypothetical protein
MRNSTALPRMATTAVLLAWSGVAAGQSSSIELLDVSTASPLHRAAATRSTARQPQDSALRRASRERDTATERRSQRGHSGGGARHPGASAGIQSQSEVAEHRQERRGSTAAKGGRSGNGPGGK